jgi:hypothetical protein
MLPLLLAVSLPAQYDPRQPLPEHVIVLSRSRAAAQKEFAHLPSYVCDEVVERWYKRPRDRDFRLEDSLHLQVAVTDKGEIHAPAGATRFEDRPLGRMAEGGLIGNGEFSTHVRNILFSGTATFESDIEEVIDGRRTYKFRYRMPQNLGGYRLRVAGQDYRVAHAGAVWFDASSLDLRQLEIHALDLPLALAIETIATRINFDRIRISDASRLVPVAAETVLKHFSGDRRRNLIRFSNCRQFRSETKLILDEPQ